MGDYVGDPYQNVITIQLPPLPPKYAKMRIKVTRLVFWFFRQPTAKTPAPIFIRPNTSNDVVLREDVPFGGPEYKILHFDPIFPQNVNFLPIFDGTSKRP